MTYTDAVERALLHMEAHLNEEADLTEIAREAGYSLYHFHRVFAAYVGESLKEYIRKRRLTRAAHQLVESRMPLIDIAIDNGYGSREAFTRAFVQHFGFSPASCRHEKRFCGLREPMTREALQLAALRASDALEPELVRLPARMAAGHVYPLRADGSNLRVIPDIWTDWKTRKRWTELPPPLRDDESIGVVFPSDTLDFLYLVGLEVAESAVLRIPAWPAGGNRMLPDAERNSACGTAGPVAGGFRVMLRPTFPIHHVRTLAVPMEETWTTSASWPWTRTPPPAPRFAT